MMRVVGWGRHLQVGTETCPSPNSGRSSPNPKEETNEASVSAASEEKSRGEESS